MDERQTEWYNEKHADIHGTINELICLQDEADSLNAKVKEFKTQRDAMLEELNTLRNAKTTKIVYKYTELKIQKGSGVLAKLTEHDINKELQKISDEGWRIMQLKMGTYRCHFVLEREKGEE